MSIAEHTVVGAVNNFVAMAQDAELRHASIMVYLRTILTDITPADLTTAETGVLIDTLKPAYRRLTEAAPGRLVPRIVQLSEILKRVAPADLFATEALTFLTLLIPVHSRVITARAGGANGQPLQRLRLAAFE
ncbi:MAG: hypothetical protein ACR2JI_15710 [Mycobacterium sp.]